MCGVAGIHAYHPDAAPVDTQALLRMRDAMLKRGPDDAGQWFDEHRKIGLAHRRLSIIDLHHRANQPMCSHDGSRVISFNGEIYNFQILRQELEAQGCIFRTDSDTEVLLHLHQIHGPEMVKRLRGMYAFALWDATRQSLWLARDPYGIKPLYYADNGKQLWVASQVKALLAGGVDATPNPVGLAGFLVFGSVPEPHTTHQSIHAVPAGSLIQVDRHGVHPPRQFFSIATTFADAKECAPSLEPNTLQHTLCDVLRESVRHHLVADVPVGVFLSAGLDSATLTGLMRDCGPQHIPTVTLAFDEFRDQPQDESQLASQIAQHYGTEHYTRIVKQAEFQEDLPHVLAAMDQPSIDGINHWFASKAMRETGHKVAISGLGGDELFGGYPSFRDVPRWVRWLDWPSRLPMAAQLNRFGYRHLSRWLPRLHPKSAGMLALGGSYAGAYLLRRGLFMRWELSEANIPDILQTGLAGLQELDLIRSTLTPDPGSPYGRVATLEASLYLRNQLLRDIDWASMAHSLEVRVPLVDSVLLEQLAPLLTASQPVNTKRLLTNCPQSTLSSTIRDRAKTGFDIPLGTWVKRQERLSNLKHTFAMARGAECRPMRRWALFVLDRQMGG